MCQILHILVLLLILHIRHLLLRLVGKIVLNWLPCLLQLWLHKPHKIVGLLLGTRLNGSRGGSSCHSLAASVTIRPHYGHVWLITRGALVSTRSENGLGLDSIRLNLP